MAERPRTFRVPVSTGIFEHYRRMKDAIWLYLWFIDRTTREITTDDGRRLGIVLGGVPIRDSEPAQDFGCSECTVRNWRRRLAREGYIDQTRTPAGHVIRIHKSKKWPGGSVKNYRSDRQESTDRTGRNVPLTPAVIGRSRSSDRYNPAIPIRKTGQDRTVAAAAASDSASQNQKAWRSIGLKSPVGPKAFRVAWEERFVAGWDGREDRVDFLERFLVDCQDHSIPVPPAFYEAKRRMEARRKARQSVPELNMPTIRDLEPDGL